MDAADDATRRMVDSLVEQRIVTDPRVRDAMARVPRDAFVPTAQRADAHVDAPLPIGGGQTISAPHMVALMAHALDVQPGQRVLEVGGGSGYHAAVIAHLAAPGGSVVSVEIRAELAEAARAALAPLRLPVEVVVADGSRGVPERAPFDRISVACGAPRVPPPLVEQLAPGGVLVIPVGALADQTLVRVEKRADGSMREEPLMAVRFVPLVGEYGWRL